MLCNVVVTGGGTGGHVFTGIAVLDEVRRRYPQARTSFIGSSLGQEVTLVPPSGHEWHAIDVRPLRLNGLSGAARSLAQIPAAVLAAGRILRALGPEVVLGIGGPASGPALIAARTLGLSTLLHEQNAVPGLANRLAGRFVPRILVGLPQVRGRFVARPGVVLTGNPVRAELSRALLEAEPGPMRRGTAEDPMRVLVLGGSDGSSFLNRRMPTVLMLAAAQAGVHVSVLHQSGGRERARLELAYAEAAALATGADAGLVAEVSAFLTDIGRAYLTADVAVALAGAGTLSELALAGVASLVVPLATSADDHQRENAFYFARHGAIRLIDERGWQDETAAAQLAALLRDAAQRAVLGQRCRQLATPGAASAIVDQLELAARHRSGTPPRW